MSQLSDTIYSSLKQLYPLLIIKKEFHIKTRGRDFFFDFFLPQLNLLVEADGMQHEEYSSLFHRSETDLFFQRERDRLKEEWACDNGYNLVRFKQKEIKQITPEYVKEKIAAAVNLGKD